MRAGMRAGKQASLRSLRLREADRAPANAGARLRLRAEVRRSRVAQAGLVVSVGIGATRLRRPQSVTPPPRRIAALAPALYPPATAYRHRSGAAHPPCDDIPTSLWGPRPLPWRRAPEPRPPFQGPRPLPWSCALALEPCPLQGRFGIALVPRPPRRRSGLAFEPRPALGATTFALELCPLPWSLCLCEGVSASLRRCAPALGARDAKNRRFWSLAVKTDGFSRYRK